MQSILLHDRQRTSAYSPLSLQKGIMPSVCSNAVAALLHLLRLHAERKISAKRHVGAQVAALARLWQQMVLQALRMLVPPASVLQER